MDQFPETTDINKINSFSHKIFLKTTSQIHDINFIRFNTRNIKKENLLKHKITSRIS